MIADVEKVIREYLPNIIHMSLTTCAGNRPWVCQVHYSYDEDLNIYFSSRENTRHGREIAKNPNVAGNMAIQHTLQDKPRCVSFEGTAELLNNVDESSSAYITYSKRFGRDSSMLDEAKQPEGHKFYKVTVSKFYLFDSRESSPSTKYELSWPPGLEEK